MDQEAKRALINSLIGPDGGGEELPEVRPFNTPSNGPRPFPAYEDI
jgi:hypothetical protein